MFTRLKTYIMEKRTLRKPKVDVGLVLAIVDLAKASGYTQCYYLGELDEDQVDRLKELGLTATIDKECWLISGWNV